LFSYWATEDFADGADGFLRVSFLSRAHLDSRHAPIPPRHIYFDTRRNIRLSAGFLLPRKLERSWRHAPPPG
jgi:hypothetical protein